MTTPHKHAEYIKALADNKGVEHACDRFDGWRDVTHFATFDISDCRCRFRIKPHKWQREIDAQKAGRVTQVRDIRIGGEWSDGIAWDFDCEVSEFRIKPEVVRFRVALTKYGTALIADTEKHATEVAAHSSFVKWIGDWQEVEVAT